MSPTSSSDRHFHTRDEIVETRSRMGMNEALYRCRCEHVIGWRRVRNYPLTQDEELNRQARRVDLAKRRR